MGSHAFYWREIFALDSVDISTHKIFLARMESSTGYSQETKPQTIVYFLVNSNEFVSTKMYDKREDFDFEIANFPF